MDAIIHYTMLVDNILSGQNLTSKEVSFWKDFFIKSSGRLEPSFSINWYPAIINHLSQLLFNKIQRLV